MARASPTLLLESLAAEGRYAYDALLSCALGNSSRARSGGTTNGQVSTYTSGTYRSTLALRTPSVARRPHARLHHGRSARDRNLPRHSPATRRSLPDSKRQHGADAARGRLALRQQ